MPTITGAVQDQFGQVAANYRTSVVHAAGADLEAIVELVRQGQPSDVLDVGCGAGHVAVAVAPWSTSVVACDLTAPMLGQVQTLARERGVTNIETREADVTALPFADQTFDVVVSRYSAHHWAQPLAAVHECVRVLKPGGRLIIGDIIAPDAPALDTFLQTFEYLRDRSHVRDYTLAEWQAFFAQAGLHADIAGTWPVPLDFDDWVRRMATPPAQVDMLRHLFATATDEANAYFALTDGSQFTLQCAVLHAKK